MASDSRTEANARALSGALDAIEAALDALEPGAGAEVVAERLAGPVRASHAAAQAALGEAH